MRPPFAAPEIVKLWRAEFHDYATDDLRRDLVAGLTVAAVALPLALAFGVASGSTPAAGLVTAIVSGIIIGLLSGAPYQISGPTGAMSAVLIGVALDQGLRGLWLAGLLAGAMILALGLLNLGRIVHFIPAPVITGFTSGIALIIAIGQVDNLLGTATPAKESAAQKALTYLEDPPGSAEWRAIACGAVVVATMLLLPRLGRVSRLPSALLGIALATVLAELLGWDVATIGSIPRGIVLDDRLVPNADDLGRLDDVLAPAFAIAMLGSIESLLCGVVAGRMTGQKLAVNQELVAQGVGNLILPFFGGVPATAAIARTSVGVKAGGATRLVSVFHAVALLLGALFFAGAIGRVPLAALAGVLMVTAWRMNEWHVIRYYWRHRLTSALATFAVTMLATVVLDLTQAIIAGLVLSLMLFLRQVSRLEVTAAPVDWEKMRAGGADLPADVPDARVVYVGGALFFGAANQFVEAIESQPPTQELILSMRGVPMIDVSAIQALEHVWRAQVARGGELYLTGLQPQVRRLIERSGLAAMVGEERILWSADRAILRACRTASDASAHAPVATGPTADDGLDDLPFGVVTAD